MSQSDKSNQERIAELEAKVARLEKLVKQLASQIESVDERERNGVGNQWNPQDWGH